MPFKTPHPLYSVWYSMKERCRNKNLKQWLNYGGRGISVCQRWLDPKVGFKNFVADMGPRPDGYTLDRINNDGNYEPSNCKWSSRKEQQRNQSVTVKLVIEGIEYLACSLADQTGLKRDTIVNRAKQGISFDEVICQKKRVFKPGLSLGGKANGNRQKSKTHCTKGHEYSKENTYLSPEGWRRCRTCHAEKEAIRRSKMK